MNDVPGSYPGVFFVHKEETIAVPSKLPKARHPHPEYIPRFPSVYKPGESGATSLSLSQQGSGFSEYVCRVELLLLFGKQSRDGTIDHP